MSSKSKASQAFVWVILGLLVVGLAGFGVSGFGGSVRSVAAVGDSEIDVNAYGRALQRELSDLSQQSGETVSLAEAMELGLDRAVLQRRLETAALNEATRRAGLSVGDAEVSRQILEIPGFRGPDGNFDRDAYQFTLEQNGLTVAQFETEIREELARTLLQGAIAAGVQPAPGYGDTIFRFLGERRGFSYAQVTEEMLDAPVPDPGTEAARAAYEANPEAFTVPETRQIAYAVLTPEMVAAQLADEIPDDELRAAYAARADQFSVPARRMVSRLGFADDAAAQAAADAIAAGDTTFEAVVAERDLTPEDVDLGIVTEAGLDDAGAAVFGLEEPGVVGPLPSPVGPALFQVNAVLDARETSFDEARPALVAAVTADRARTAIDQQVDVLDDLLAGGATIEDLGAESDMETGTMDWTGFESTGLAADPAFRLAAARAATDDFPQIEVLDGGGLFALRLDAITPPRLRPFEEVADAAAELARTQMRQDALMARAETLAEALAAGTSAVELGLELTPAAAQTRTDLAASTLPLALTERVFALEDGAPPEALATPAGVFVLRLDTVLPPDADNPNATGLRDALVAEAAQGMAQDVIGQVARAIQAEAGITVNQQALNAVHATLP